MELRFLGKDANVGRRDRRNPSLELRKISFPSRLRRLDDVLLDRDNGLLRTFFIPLIADIAIDSARFMDRKTDSLVIGSRCLRNGYALRCI